MNLPRPTNIGVKFYIHPINPCYSATYADDFFAGWAFGIWEHPFPALEPSFYHYQSKHLAGAKDTQQKAEIASSKIADAPRSKKTLKLPTNVAPHSHAASYLFPRAIRESLMIEWPWTNGRENEWRETGYDMWADSGKM